MMTELVLSDNNLSDADLNQILSVWLEQAE
jgi:hypothetical protein